MSIFNIEKKSIIFILFLIFYKNNIYSEYDESNDINKKVEMSGDVLETYNLDKGIENSTSRLSKNVNINLNDKYKIQSDKMEERIVRYVDDLTKITAEKERISTELALATKIQANMLPNIFPPFPDRTEFDIYASMDPAKEVGGDFYDFFLVDDDHLCVVMADVSGKGIPAALFMMATKIIIANYAKMGKSPSEILTAANSAICSRNQEDMFVTVWLGILEISTGKLTAANAGHEFPVLKQDKVFELYKDKHGFVLGGMEGARYREYEIQMEPGSKVFVYTDGAAEATNSNDELFGAERLVTALQKGEEKAPGEILETVREEIEKFVGNAPQFDDLTMLCLQYNGS